MCPWSTSAAPSRATTSATGRTAREKGNLLRPSTNSSITSVCTRARNRSHARSPDAGKYSPDRKTWKYTKEHIQVGTNSILASCKKYRKRAYLDPMLQCSRYKRACCCVIVYEVLFRNWTNFSNGDKLPVSFFRNYMKIYRLDNVSTVEYKPHCSATLL